LYDPTHGTSKIINGWRLSNFCEDCSEQSSEQTFRLATTLLSEASTLLLEYDDDVEDQHGKDYDDQAKDDVAV
jgi:hypothetical protein